MTVFSLARGGGFLKEGDHHDPGAKRTDRYVQRVADAEMLGAEAAQGRDDAAAEDLADTDHKSGSGRHEPQLRAGAPDSRGA
jgi:hypothetical protein